MSNLFYHEQPAPDMQTESDFIQKQQEQVARQRRISNFQIIDLVAGLTEAQVQERDRLMMDSKSTVGEEAITLLKGLKPVTRAELQKEKGKKPLLSLREQLRTIQDNAVDFGLTTEQADGIHDFRLETLRRMLTLEEGGKPVFDLPTTDAISSEITGMEVARGIV